MPVPDTTNLSTLLGSEYGRLVQPFDYFNEVNFALRHNSAELTTSLFVEKIQSVKEKHRLKPLDSERCGTN